MVGMFWGSKIGDRGILGAGVCKAKKELQAGIQRGQRLWLKLIK